MTQQNTECIFSELSLNCAIYFHCILDEVKLSHFLISENFDTITINQ